MNESAQELAGARRPAGRYDAGRRRLAKRSGREAGCWTYIAADELEAAGFAPGGPLPWYRVWGRRRGTVIVQLYREA
jgi:hypothetical protein